MTLINNIPHKEDLNPKKIFFVNILSLIMGFTGGLLIYILSAYFQNIWNSPNIGWVFIIANIILLIILLNLHKIVHAVGSSALFQLLAICKISLFIALITLTGKISQTILLVSYIIIEAVSWAILKMILEAQSTDSMSGKIYGFNLTVTNIGLIFAPIIATQLLGKFGFSGIFYLAIVLNMLIFIIAFFILLLCA